jgi:aldose 1-epimerase
LFPAAVTAFYPPASAAEKAIKSYHEFIPTGEKRPLQGTPVDFTRPAAIGSRIRADDPQLRLAGGYDHCWIFPNFET